MNSHAKIQNFTTKSVINIILLLCLGFLLFYWYMYSLHCRVNVDAGYYIGTSRLINQGWVPYLDFRVGYTPLAFYMMQVPVWLYCTTNNISFLFIMNMIMMTCDAMLVGGVIRNILNNKTLSYLASCMFMIMGYNLGGGYVYLEPYVCFWGLMGILLLTKQSYNSNTRIIVSGFCFGCAFLCKQYGLLYLGTGMAYLFLKEIRNISFRERTKKVVILGVGSLLAVGIMTIFLIIQGVSVTAIMDQLFMNGYGERTSNEMISGFKYLWTLYPWAIFFILWGGIRRKYINEIIMIAIGIILGCMQFYMHVFDHYVILILPFFIWLWLIVINDIMSLSETYISLRPNRIPIREILIVLLTFILISCPIYELGKDAIKRYIRTDFRKEQLNQMERVVQTCAIQCNQATLCYNSSIPFYVNPHIIPPQVKQFGFAFGFESQEYIINRLKYADNFIIYEPNYQMLLDGKWNDFISLLHSEFHLVRVGNLLVYQRIRN